MQLKGKSLYEYKRGPCEFKTDEPRGVLDHPFVGLNETNFSNGFLKGIHGFGPVGMDEVGL